MSNLCSDSPYAVKINYLHIPHAGWGKYWGNETLYLGYTKGVPDPFDMNHPGFSVEGAQWLVDNRKLKGKIF